jgi:hypothetical protein
LQIFGQVSRKEKNVMSASEKINKGMANADPEAILADLVKMARRLKSEEEAECIKAAQDYPEFPYVPTITFDIPKEGSPMRKLLEILAEFLFGLNNAYKMHFKVDISIVSITRDKITVIIEENHPDSDEEELVWGIRNGFLIFLQDIIPCDFFQAVYFNKSKRKYALEYLLPFYGEVQEDLWCPIRVIEENLSPFREKFRPVIKELSNKLE